MDWELNEDQIAVRDMVRDFARNEIAPGTIERDRAGEFPADLIAQAGELGLCGMAIPEEWGGSELDPIAYCLVLEEIASVCPSTAVTLSVTNSVCAQPRAVYTSSVLLPRAPASASRPQKRHTAVPSRPVSRIMKTWPPWSFRCGTEP